MTMLERKSGSRAGVTVEYETLDGTWSRAVRARCPWNHFVWPWRKSVEKELMQQFIYILSLLIFHYSTYANKLQVTFSSKTDSSIGIYQKWLKVVLGLETVTILLREKKGKMFSIMFFFNLISKNLPFNCFNPYIMLQFVQ